MLFGVSSNDCNRIAELEDLIRAENGTLKAVRLVVLRQHDEAVDLVGAAGSEDVLIGDDFYDAGHLLSFGSINFLDDTVGIRTSLNAGEEFFARELVHTKVPVTTNDSFVEFLVDLFFADDFSFTIEIFNHYA